MRPIEQLYYRPEYAAARALMRKVAHNGLLDGRPYPETLLHFTDMGGLLGIVQTNSMWATSAYALNDEQEIRYGIEQVRSAIEALRQQDDCVLYGPCLTALNIDLPYWMVMAAPFVVSFCPKETSAQWLHYGRSGTGVAVQFRSDGLKTHTSAGLFPVIYEVNEQREAVARLLGAIKDELTRQTALHPEGTPGLEELAVGVAQAYVMIATALMKDATFKVEDEWRLIHLRGRMFPTEDTSEPMFRCSAGRIRPYVELIWKKTVMPYPQAILGHSCPEDELSPSLRLLFWHRYQTLVDSVPRSGIKVRP